MRRNWMGGARKLLERNIENNSNGNSESSKIGRNASKFYKTIKNGKQSTMNNKNENNNVLVSRKKRKQFKGNEDKKSRDILELENQFISTIDFDKDSAKNLNEEPNPTTTTTTSKTTSTTISNPQQSNNISNFSTSNIILDPKMMTKSSINSKKVQIDTNESSSPTKPIPSHDGKIIFIDEGVDRTEEVYEFIEKWLSNRQIQFRKTIAPTIDSWDYLL